MERTTGLIKCKKCGGETWQYSYTVHNYFECKDCDWTKSVTTTTMCEKNGLV